MLHFVYSPAFFVLLFERGEKIRYNSAIAATYVNIWPTYTYVIYIMILMRNNWRSEAFEGLIESKNNVICNFVCFRNN